MDLTIPAKNLRTFSNAIQCLAKTGQTLFISCHPGELTLRTINDGRSSFMCATFGRDFFEGRGPLVSAPKALSQRKRKGEGRKRKRKRRGESKRDRRGDISNSLESSTDEGESDLDNSDSSTDEEDPKFSQSRFSQSNGNSGSGNADIDGDGDVQMVYFKAKVLLKLVANIMKGKSAHSSSNDASSFHHSGSGYMNSLGGLGQYKSKPTSLPVLSLRITSHGGGVSYCDDDGDGDDDDDDDEEDPNMSDSSANSNSNDPSKSSMLLRFQFRNPCAVTKTHILPMDPLKAPIIAVCPRRRSSHLRISNAMTGSLMGHLLGTKGLQGSKGGGIPGSECAWTLTKGDNGFLTVSSWSHEDNKRQMLEHQQRSPNTTKNASKHHLKTEAKVGVGELPRYKFWVPKTRKKRKVDLNTIGTRDSDEDDSEDEDQSDYPPTLTTQEGTPEVRLVFSLRELKSLLSFCDGMQKTMGYGGGNTSCGVDGSFVSHESGVGSGDTLLLDVYFVHGGRPISFSVDSMGGSGRRDYDDDDDDDDDDEDEDEEEPGGEKPTWSLELILATLDWKLIPLPTSR